MRIWTDNPQFEWLVEPTMPKRLMGCFDGDGGDGGGDGGGEQGPGYGDGGGADPGHDTAGVGADDAGDQGGDDAGSQFGGHDPGSIGDRGTGTHAGGPGDTGTGPDDAGGGDEGPADTGFDFGKAAAARDAAATYSETGDRDKSAAAYQQSIAASSQAPSASQTSRPAPAQSKPAPKSFTKAQELAAIALGWPDIKSWDDLGKLAAVEKDNKALGTFLGMMGFPGLIAKHAMGRTPGSKTSATWGDILSGRVPGFTKDLAEAVAPNLMNRDSTVGIGPLDTPFDFDQYAATEAAIEAYQETGDREASFQAYVDHMAKNAQDKHFDERMKAHEEVMSAFEPGYDAGGHDEGSYTPPSVDTTPPSGDGSPGGGSAPGGSPSSGGGANTSGSYYGDYLVPRWGRYLPQNGMAPNRRAEIGG